MLDLEDLQSKSFQIISLLLRIVSEHDSLAIPSIANIPSVMDCNDGRSIYIISFEFIQYSRLLLIKIAQTHDHLM